MYEEALRRRAGVDDVESPASEANGIDAQIERRYGVLVGEGGGASYPHVRVDGSFVKNVKITRRDGIVADASGRRGNENASVFEGREEGMNVDGIFDAGKIDRSDTNGSSSEQSARRAEFGDACFGLGTLPPRAEKLILMDDEENALAAHQCTRIPAVSVVPTILINDAKLPELFRDRFQTVTLWFDERNSPVRDSWIKAIGRNKCRIVPSSQPSATKAMAEGKNLVEIVSTAEIVGSHVAPDFTSFKDLKSDVKSSFTDPDAFVKGIPFAAFPSLTHYLGGFRAGELTVITGHTGSGKSTLLSQLSLDMCAANQLPTVWGSFEMKVERLSEVMLRQNRFFLRKSPQDVKHLHDFDYLADAFGTLPMHYMKFHGTTQVDNVIETMEQAVIQLGVKHVVIDNLSHLLPIGLSSRMSANRLFDAEEALNRLRAFASSRIVHVTVVVHPRKLGEKSGLSIDDIGGTAKISQDADNIIVIQRDRSVIEVKKNRYTGNLGAFNVQFDPVDLRFVDKGFDR